MFKPNKQTTPTLTRRPLGDPQIFSNAKTVIVKTAQSQVRKPSPLTPLLINMFYEKAFMLNSHFHALK